MCLKQRRERRRGKVKREIEERDQTMFLVWMSTGKFPKQQHIKEYSIGRLEDPCWFSGGGQLRERGREGEEWMRRGEGNRCCFQPSTFEVSCSAAV